MRRSSFILLLLFISVRLAYSADPDVISVTGSAAQVRPQYSVLERALRSAPDAAVFPIIAIEPVASLKLQTMAEQDSLPKQIGVSRHVAGLSTAGNTGRQLSWHKLPANGHYWGIEISSPQALALRVGMTADNIPESAEFRFFSKQEGAAADIQLVSAGEIINILKGNRDADPTDPNGKIFWSPTVAGDTIGIEIYLPENLDPSSVQVAFPLVSHISIFPFSSTGFKNSIQSFGDSDPCQNDATCADSWENLRNSVAGMQFSTLDGTFICTGSLLNDKDTTTSKPYFITANHCIGTQSVASTLETHWFWQSATCNSAILSPLYRMISGGAILLHTQGMSSGDPTSSSMDASLLKLNSAPPAGAYFAGWTTAVPPGIGSSRTGIHHPDEDWKKISYGTSGGDAACGWLDDDGLFFCESGSGNFYVVDWTDGGIEGGSSGSALYYNSDSVIGMLSGGFDGSCAGSRSWYSSFRAAYAAGNYGQWLNTVPDNPDPVLAPALYLLLK